MSRERILRAEREQRIRDANVLECPRGSTRPDKMITGFQVIRDDQVINGLKNGYSRAVSKWPHLSEATQGVLYRETGGRN